MKSDREKFAFLNKRFYKDSKVPLTWDQYLAKDSTAYEAFRSWLLGKYFAEVAWRWNEGRGGKF